MRLNQHIFQIDNTNGTFFTTLKRCKATQQDIKIDSILISNDEMIFFPFLLVFMYFNMKDDGHIMRLKCKSCSRMYFY
jgi:hypothetical protein